MSQSATSFNHLKIVGNFADFFLAKRKEWGEANPKGWLKFADDLRKGTWENDSVPYFKIEHNGDGYYEASHFMNGYRFTFLIESKEIVTRRRGIVRKWYMIFTVESTLINFFKRSNPKDTIVYQDIVTLEKERVGE